MISGVSVNLTGNFAGPLSNFSAMTLPPVLLFTCTEINPLPATDELQRQRRAEVFSSALQSLFGCGGEGWILLKRIKVTQLPASYDSENL